MRRTHNRYLFVFSVLALCFLLAACLSTASPPESELEGMAEVPNSPFATATDFSLTTIPNLIPGLTATATPTQVRKEASNANFTPSPSPLSQSQVPFRVCSPLEGHSLVDLLEIVTNPFQPPPPGKDTGHHGVDFAYYRRGERLSILGVPIHSVLPGKVVSRLEGMIPYGNMLMVETPYAELSEQVIQMLEIPRSHSIYLVYAHMKDAPLPGLYDFVACDKFLGEVGNTPAGWSSDPHLHLEGRIGLSGVTFNSMAFYDTRASEEEMENYKLWRMSGEFRLFDPLALLSLLSDT